MNQAAPDGGEGASCRGQGATEGESRTTTASLPFPIRGLLLGLGLCPLIVLWGEYTEVVALGPDLIALSLPPVLVFPLLVLLACNALVRRLAPRWTLPARDLLYAYAINLAAVTVCGIGMMQYLVSFLAGARHFATPENGWASSWLPRVPGWVLPDPAVLPAFYDGGGSFFTPRHLRGWAAPILAWSVFLFALLGFMYCLGSLLRRQWGERERLLFPMTVLPLEAIGGGNTGGPAAPAGPWRDTLFWGAAAVALVLQSLASLHHALDPRVPYLPIKFNEGALDIGGGLAASPPWSGVGMLKLSLYPFVIGLSYLLPLDVSFSCWFFYLLVKAEGVIAAAVGAGGGAPSGSAAARAPFPNEQAAGAFLALALLSVAGALPHLRRAFRAAFPDRRAGRGAVPEDTDALLEASSAGGPLSYRVAFLGLFGCSTILIGFGWALGIPPPVGGFFFATFFLLSLAVARIRAQAGFPWSQGPAAESILLGMVGTAHYETGALVGLSSLRWFDSTFRSTALPFQMEAMHIGASAGIHGRHLTVGIVLSTVVAVASAWACLLGLYYHHGAGSGNVSQFLTMMGRYNWETLQDRLSNPRGADTAGLFWAGGGMLATFVLNALYNRVSGWPLHPIGFVAGTGDHLMPLFWFPVLLGWGAKVLALRYGGMALYRRLLPASLGLILGDYAASGAWSLVYLWMGIPGYRTFPN